MTTTFSIRSLSKISEHFADNPAEFCVQLHCEVISSETRGGEAFAVTAISPAQLRADLEAAPDAVEFGRGHVMLLDYNEKLIRDRLQRLIDGSGASTWDELHRYVVRYFDWV